MRRRLIVLGCLTSVLLLAGTAASATAPAKFPTDAASYVPAKVGSRTVISRGGSCPEGTGHPAEADGLPDYPEPLVLAAGYPCQPECANCSNRIFPQLLVLSPQQADALEQQDEAAQDDGELRKLRGTAHKRVLGVSIEIVTYELPPSPKRLRIVIATATPVKETIVLRVTESTKKRALAAMRAMLRAANGESGSGGGGSSGGGGTSGGGGATGPTPTIVSFTGTEDGTVDCHNGNQQNFSAHWQTTDAVRVAISEGGNDLSPSGEGSLPFNCLNGPRSYTLTAYGSGGRTATESITLTPRNVQQPSGDDDSTDTT